MNYKDIYNRKLTDINGALAAIKNGDIIVSGSVGMEAAYFLSNLHIINGKVHGIQYYTGLGMRNYPFISDKNCRESFSIDCVFLMGPGREAHRAGLLNVYPGNLHNATVRWIQTHEGRLVCVLPATPMDSHGYFRISLSLIHERYLVDHADYVIIEVNPKMPAVFGDTQLHVSDVDCIIETEYSLPEISASEPSADEITIGQYISDLIPDRSCIQLGIGGIPDAAAHALFDKHDLGVHTEMLTNSLVDLVDHGVITNKYKNLDNGKMVGAFALGNSALYDLIRENPGVAIKSGSYVNSPHTISKIENFVSVNTGMSVDLGGQVCSESIGSLIYSGTGGQSDTAIGAEHSPGGKNIIALRSVKHTKNGDISSINAQLPAGSVVSLSRNDIDYIVTEYGIAQMRGRNIRQRVDNLISIAHPDYRSELRKDAEKYLLW